MRRLQRLVAIVGVALTIAGCGSSTPSAPSSPATLHSETADPLGDAIVSAGNPIPPDLVHAVADVVSGSLTFTIQFASGTFDRATTRVTIELDTDQNPATGNAAAGPIGIDYVLDLWTARNPPAIVQQAA